MADAPAPYLYLLMRNDLDSMNPGKAVAHGAHAANKFTYDVQRRLAGRTDPLTDMTVERNFNWWVRSADGFGTTITLSGSLMEIQTAVTMAQAMDHPAALSVDPTYPYLLHREYADLIKHPEDHPPVPTGNGMMLCFRAEITAAYVFGFKDVLRPILRDFPLMK